MRHRRRALCGLCAKRTYAPDSFYMTYGQVASHWSFEELGLSPHQVHRLHQHHHRFIESGWEAKNPVCDESPAGTRRRSRESRSEEQRSEGRSPSGASQFGCDIGERRCRGRASGVTRSLAMDLAADAGCATGRRARGARSASGPAAARESERTGQ